MGPAARPPAKAQPMWPSKGELMSAPQEARSGAGEPADSSRTTKALVVPTTREGIRIWDRLRIRKDARMATSPPKMKKRKIPRLRPTRGL